MKKYIIFNIVILLVLSICTSVSATTDTIVGLKANNYQVKQGDTFKVTLSVSCEKGINGIDTTYAYDTSALELISANLINPSEWENFSQGARITILSNSVSKITNADIYEFTFKVKENATVGAVVKINTGKILFDTDEATNSEIEIEEKSVSITVLDKQPTTDSSGNNGQDESSSDDKNEEGEQVQPPQNDNKNENLEDKNKAEDIQQNGNTENDNKAGDIQQNGNTENNDKNAIDNTIAKDKMPQTGDNMILPMLLIASSLTAISSFIAYRKCKGI